MKKNRVVFWWVIAVGVAFVILVLLDRAQQGLFPFERESWVVNLCSDLSQPEICRRVSTQRATFLSDEQVKWWFDFQESIGTESYKQEDDAKFREMTSLIDSHVAKIIAQANPIGYFAIENGKMYIFPRSRMNKVEIGRMINGPKSQDRIVSDGVYPNVHINVRLAEEPTGDVVVGAKVVEPKILNEKCSSRTTHNMLVDMIAEKVIYIDQEVEYDASACNKIR